MTLDELKAATTTAWNEYESAANLLTQKGHAWVELNEKLRAAIPPHPFPQPAANTAAPSQPALVGQWAVGGD